MSSTQWGNLYQVATYEVSLRGPMPASVRDRSTGMAVQTVRSQTVLFRYVRDVGELDTLLDRLRSTGLVLTEIHAGAEPPDAKAEASGRESGAAHRYYEVWVSGELGDKLLGYLGWSHRLVAERQIARGEVSPHELNAFLSRCSAAGLAVDRVRRVAASGSPDLAPY
ncbi:MAG TPA: hypothetical protein VNQ53_09855 [Nocardioides sp.]|nr:hypothetical protein [Nocardioides sp.]